MKPQFKRIMFTGPSGVGKTTLAKFIAGIGGGDDPAWPFISGSVSDLLPITKAEPHRKMLSHDKEFLYQQDFQILNLRKKLFIDKDTYVSDRSYLDSAAYFLYKQSDTIPQCELEHFLELCKMCLCQQCDHLFVLDFTPYMVKNWVMEDNNKRILNKYFQAHISSIVKYILSDWQVDLSEQINYINNGLFKMQTSLWNGGYSCGRLNSLYGSVDITLIKEPGLEIRKQIICSRLGINLV